MGKMSDPSSVVRVDRSSVRHSAWRAVWRTARQSAFSLLAPALGLFLLSAVALKTHWLSIGDDKGAEAIPRSWLMAATQAELLLGVWLLSGLRRRLSWWAAFAFFVVISCVSFFLAFNGQPPCRCLGRVAANHWLLFGVDAGCVTLLIMCVPNGVLSPLCCESSPPSSPGAPHECSTCSPARHGERRKVVNRLARIFFRRSAAVTTAWLCGAIFLATGGASLEDARVRIPQERLDFGEQWSQKRFNWTLPVTNSSNRKLVISGLSRSCQCATVELAGEPLEIAPGKTAEANVLVDLTYGAPTPSKSHPRDIEIRFSMILEREQPARFTLRGKVCDAMAVSPGEFNFGQSLVEGLPLAAEAVVIEPLVPLAEIRAACPADLGAVELLQGTDGRRRCAFTPRPRPAGSINGEIELIATTGVWSD